MIIELHLIQNFAPSNLNRDDTNNPKDCEFGGVRRARISSQCLKRAIRHHPKFAAITGIEPSMRTRLIVKELSQSLVARGLGKEEANALAETFAKHYSSKNEKTALDKGRTSILLFLSHAELNEIADYLKEKPTPEQIKKFAEDFAKSNKNRPSAPDIAMFGRMLADRPDTNVDAACQVAHAISTHRVTMDIDFFTAMDDLQAQEETGAGMMGVTAFNSACFYRYAAIDFDQLVANLNGDTGMALKTVEAFLYASTLAIPSGKQNSFAAQNPPDLVLVVLRGEKQGWSLANAFEKPVHATGQQSLTHASIAALDTYWKHLNHFYGETPQCFVATLDAEAPLEELKTASRPDFASLTKAVIEALRKE